MLCRSIHEGEPPAAAASAAPGDNRPRPDQISFGLLLNLPSVCHPADKSVVWGNVVRYAPGVAPESNPPIARATCRDRAVQYVSILLFAASIKNKTHTNQQNSKYT